MYQHTIVVGKRIKVNEETIMNKNWKKYAAGLFTASLAAGLFSTGALADDSIDLKLSLTPSESSVWMEAVDYFKEQEEDTPFLYIQVSSWQEET